MWRICGLKEEEKLQNKENDPMRSFIIYNPQFTIDGLKPRRTTLTREEGSGMYKQF
jgi:hypothetical protein